ncbi:hypothetical protein GJ496_004941 [Pomphorhynchus laevis]|nr:hypothetical protein GJ496_004941 [Pomphorhynchus laevis]
MSKRFATHASTEDHDLIVQFLVEFKQDIDCGCGYVKLFSSGTSQGMLTDSTPYYIMFGPDSPMCKDDVFTHVYTLHLYASNRSYEVRIDNESVQAGNLTDDWSILQPREIATRLMPSQDIEAANPDDWDDEADGDWSTPMKTNQAYMGKWVPRTIDNPDYRGPWIAKQIPNPEYVGDHTTGIFKDIGLIGIDVWQVKSGTIFGEFLITDDVDFARQAADAIVETSKKERTVKKKIDDKEMEKMHASGKSTDDKISDDGDDKDFEDMSDTSLHRSYTSSSPIRRSSSIVFNERLNMVDLDESWGSEPLCDCNYIHEPVNDLFKSQIEFQLPCVNNSPSVKDSIIDSSAFWNDNSFTNDSSGDHQVFKIDSTNIEGDTSICCLVTTDDKRNKRRQSEQNGIAKINKIQKSETDEKPLISKESLIITDVKLPMFDQSEINLNDNFDDDDLLACAENIVSSSQSKPMIHDPTDICLDSNNAGYQKFESSKVTNIDVTKYNRNLNTTANTGDEVQLIKSVEVNAVNREERQLSTSIHLKNNLSTVVVLANDVQQNIEKKRQIALAKLKRSRTAGILPLDSLSVCQSNDRKKEELKLTQDVKQTIELKRQMALRLRQQKVSHPSKQVKRFNSLQWNY